MKTIILTILCAICFLLETNAQTQAEITAQRTISIEQIATAAKEVGLDDKKTQKLKTAFADLYKTQDEIKADTTLTAEQRKIKLNAANEKKDWHVKFILGDKVKQFAEIRKRLISEAEAKKKQEG
jgi:hypothetical protein